MEINYQWDSGFLPSAHRGCSERFRYLKNKLLIPGREIANNLQRPDIGENCEDWCKSYDGCVGWGYFKGTNTATNYCSLMSFSTCSMEINYQWDSGFLPSAHRGCSWPIIIKVSCGQHVASNCGECPQGNGAAWCNGDCRWVRGQCVAKSDTGREGPMEVPRDRVSKDLE